MTTNRPWPEDEDNAAIEMFSEGRNIEYIRMYLPRPENAPTRTTGAVNSRMSLLYSQGKINITRGDGNPREFDMEAVIEERANQEVARRLERLRQHLVW